MNTLRLKLPQLPFQFRLEEINVPASLARQLAGQTVSVDVLPEEMPFTRKVPDFWDSPSLIAPDGSVWNDYRPTRLILKDREVASGTFPGIGNLAHGPSGHLRWNRKSFKSANSLKQSTFLQRGT